MALTRPFSGMVTASSVSGTISDTTTINGEKVGYRDIPTVDSSSPITLSDETYNGKLLRVTSSTATITSSSALNRVGFSCMIFNNSGGDLQVVQGSSTTLTLAGTTTTGTRTIANNGMATLIMKAQDDWVVAGTGVS